MSTPRNQVNSATGIMGPTGSGKSTLAATLADYLWANWKKVLLYYLTDGGGIPSEVQARVETGIIRLFRMRTRDVNGELAFETCYRAAQGWWPKIIRPKTGEVPPGVPMIPPIAKYWEQYCPNGHLVKSVVSQSLLHPGPCPECKIAVTVQTMKVKEVLRPNKGFDDVGGVFYDGLTSMLSWEMQELGQRAGKLELKGEEGAIGGKVVSGDLKFGGVTRSHVGFAQTRGEEIVNLTMGIPNLKVPPVFTMLTHEDVDDRAMSIRGPKIAGRAKTDEAGAWFGNMLEAAKIPATNGSGYQFCLFLEEFVDGNGVKHLIKHRGSPGTMPPTLVDPVEGPPLSEFNLGKFFTLLDAALANRIAEVKAAMPDTPGVSEAWVEIGDTGIIQPQPAVVTPPVAQTAEPPSAVSELGTPAPPLPKAPAAAPPPAPAAAPAPQTAPRSRSRKPAAAPAAAPPVAAPVVAAPTPPEVPAAPPADAATSVAPAPPAPVPVAAHPPAPSPVATPPAPATSAPPVVPGAGASPARPAPPRPAAAPPPGRRPTTPPAPAAPTIPSVGGTPAGRAAVPPSPAIPPTSGPRPPSPAPRPIVPPTTT